MQNDNKVENKSQSCEINRFGLSFMAHFHFGSAVKTGQGNAKLVLR